MDSLDNAARVDIRDRIRAHAARQLVIARLKAPEDWQGALRQALAEQHRPQPLLFGGSDLKLFLQSFATFFTALMVFLF